MKNKYIMVLMLIVGMSAQGQGRMSYDFKFGIDYLNDQSAVIVSSRAGSWTFNADYWLNSNVAIGLESYSTIWQVEDLDKKRIDIKYARLNLPLSLDVSHFLDFDKKRYSLILSGGPGIARVLGAPKEEWIPTVSGTIKNLVYIGKERLLAFNFSLTSTANISQEYTTDGSFKTTARGVTSVIHSLQFGLSYKPRWITPEVHRVEPIQTNVTNNMYLTAEVVQEPKEQFYVFFDHDKWSWNELEDVPSGNLDNLYSVRNFAKEHPNRVIVITSYASDTNSSADYDMELAYNRAIFVEQALLQMGVTNEIQLVTVGKDEDEAYHSVARRVTIKFI